LPAHQPRQRAGDRLDLFAVLRSHRSTVYLFTACPPRLRNEAPSCNGGPPESVC
jgi:hypothetical protein